VVLTLKEKLQIIGQVDRGSSYESAAIYLNILYDRWAQYTVSLI